MMLDIIPCGTCPYHKSRTIPIINHVVTGCTNKQVNALLFAKLQSKGGECKYKPGEQNDNN
jgi:hypothetical protein